MERFPQTKHSLKPFPVYLSSQHKGVGTILSTLELKEVGLTPRGTGPEFRGRFARLQGLNLKWVHKQLVCSWTSGA